MKKFLPILLILATALPAIADVVPMSRAKANAEQFLKQANPARAPQLQLLFEEPKMTKAGPSDPEYFIFTDARGGFVIAGGDDTVPAILGYSTTSTIPAQGMPDNFKAWMDMWTRIVDAQRSAGAAPYEPRAAVRGNSPKVLETALWGQGDPYNLHCVVMNDDKHAITGCTATATSIVMRYHQWPERGTGTLPSYYVTDKDGKSYLVESVELGRTYEWDKMPLTKANVDWTDEQKDAVAWLMSDVGIMLKSSYSPESTGAYVEDVATGLIKHFYYDASLLMAYKKYYDTEQWIALLENEIDQNRPVIYAGYSEDYESGHAFVLSGYDENDMLYINFGWNGNSNGYYAMPNFDDYVIGHRAVIGVKKDEGGIAPDNLTLWNLGVTSPAASFSTGTAFKVSCKSISNDGTDDFTGDFAFAKYDRNDQLVEIVSAVKEYGIKRGYGLDLTDWDCVITTSIQAGDYIAPVYRSSRTPNWTPILYDHEGMTVGRLQVGDNVFLDEIVSLEYVSSTGILTVSFSATATGELRRNGSPVSTGVTVKDDAIVIDANQLPMATYTLHLERVTSRGTQTKDISLKIGLK